jgi:hypothetical protein
MYKKKWVQYITCQIELYGAVLSCIELYRACHIVHNTHLLLVLKMRYSRWVESAYGILHVPVNLKIEISFKGPVNNLLVYYCRWHCENAWYFVWLKYPMWSQRENVSLKISGIIFILHLTIGFQDTLERDLDIPPIGTVSCLRIPTSWSYFWFFYIFQHIVVEYRHIRGNFYLNNVQIIPTS